MAENTSVGSVTISLDLEVSSKLEKQVQSAADNLGDRFKSRFGKSSSGLTASFTKSMEKTVSSVNKRLDDLVKKASSTGSKIADNVSKVSDNISVKQPQATKVSKGINKDDLILRRDNMMGVQDNLNAQIDGIRNKLKELSQYDPSATLSPAFLKLEGQMLNLASKSDALTVDIRNLDQAIETFDTDRAGAGQSNLANQTAKVSASMHREAIAAERLAQAKSKTAAATERLKQSQLKTKSATDKMSKSASKAKRPLVNMGSVGRSLARNLLGVSLLIATVGKAVRAMATSFWNALKSNDQFSSSLNQIKSNLATAFQPIYEAILPAINSLMSILSKATAYLATFISMLFGKSVKASNASAKALAKAKDGMDSYGASAEEAQKIVAGFDQLNDITEQSNAGGGASGGTTIDPINMNDVEISGVSKFADKIKGVLDKAFNSAPVQAYVNFVTSYFTQMYASITRIGGAITSGILSTWNAMLPNMKVGLDNFLNLYTNIYNDLADFINNWYPKITDGIVGFINNVTNTFKPFFVLISKLWADFTGILLELWNKYGKRILDGIGEFITGAMDTFNKIWTHIVDPIIKPVIELMSDLWENHLKDIIFQIGDFVGNAIARALELYNKFIKPIIDWLVVNLGPVFTTVFGLIGSTVGGVMKGILTTVSDIIGSVRRIFDGFMDFLEGVFTGDWKKVWQGMSDIFGGIFDGLKAIFKAPINWIIEGINGFIRGLNKIKIPDWVPGVGGKGISLGYLTPLATGGVITAPTPALVGEYPGARSNPEIVTPQNIMRDTFREVMAEFMSAFMNGFGMNGVSQGAINLVVNIGGMKLLDMIIDLAKEYTKQTGKQVILNA